MQPLPTIHPLTMPKASGSRVLTYAEFKQIYIDNFVKLVVVSNSPSSFHSKGKRGVHLEKKLIREENKADFEEYAANFFPFYQTLVKANPSLESKIQLSASACYYSTPTFYHTDMKKFMDHFIADYGKLTLLDFFSHIGNDAYFFTQLFKHVYVNDNVAQFTDVLDNNFHLAGINNYSHYKGENTDVVYLDPPFAAFDCKQGDYILEGKTMKSIVGELVRKENKLIIIKHADMLNYVDYTFTWYKTYINGLSKDFMYNVERCKRMNFPSPVVKGPLLFSRISFIGKPITPIKEMLYPATFAPNAGSIKQMLKSKGYDVE